MDDIGGENQDIYGQVNLCTEDVPCSSELGRKEGNMDKDVILRVGKWRLFISFCCQTVLLRVNVIQEGSWKQRGRLRL